MDGDSTARVALVGGPDLLRASLRAALETEGLRVIGAAASVDRLAGEVRQRADVFVLEGRATATGETLAALGDVAVVLLSDAPDAARAFATHGRGWAVLPTDAPASILAAVVRTAAAGLATVAAGSGWLGEAVPNRPSSDTDDEPLAVREREVLALLADGLSNRAIAGRLGISEHTAKFHVSTIYAKLGAGNRAEAVARGLQKGLVVI